MSDWYPTQDAKLTGFLTGFVANIDAATTTLKLPAGSFGAAKEAATAWLDATAARQAAQKALDATLAVLQKQAIDTEKQLRAAAKQIKGTMNVPAKVLALLELSSVGEPTQARAAAQVPDLRATAELGVVKGKYTKRGHQGVQVFSCRTGEDHFTLLGTYTMTTFEDARPNRVPGQPEQRQYYAVYMDRDQQVGEQSPTVSVVVGTRPGSEV